MVKDSDTVQERVEELLQLNSELRSDDKTLWLAYLNQYHNLKFVLGDEAYQVLVEIMAESPSYESIRRARQRVQESGVYLSDFRKKKQREERELKLFSKKSAAELLQI